MSQEKLAETNTSKPTLPTIPENLPEELLPVYDWWKANGRQWLITLGIALLLVSGAYTFKIYRSSKITGANQELLKASGLDELENMVAKYGSTHIGNAARLRLAKAYYDASKYNDALQTYDTCLALGAPQGFVEIATLGRAHALEGLNRLDEALTIFKSFTNKNASHFLLPLATMGVARIQTQQGKKAEALQTLETLKALKTNAPAFENIIANLEGVITRYTPRTPRSLFDMANDAATITPTPKLISKPVSTPLSTNTAK